MAALAVLLLCSWSTTYLSPFKVKGRVLDAADGSPLPGVAVLVKETTTGTVTNKDGSFELEVPSAKATLVFSFVGFRKQVVKVGSQRFIQVKLEQDVEQLQEVVVKTEGYARKKNSTGAIAIIEVPDEEEVEDVHFDMSYEPADAMAGRAAGVRIRQAHEPNYKPHNTEEYAAVEENGFLEALKSPLSTFSIDVDNASYSNMRRYINGGQMPPRGAVRIEEMINYFTYDYPQPQGEDPFSVTTEVSACPWNPNHQLLHIGLQGKKIETDKLPPSNLVFLIDVSGSMDTPERLPLVKAAFRMLVHELRPQDRVSIVVYAGAAGLVLPTTYGNQKERIFDAIDRLEAGGSTAGGAGITLAYAIAEQNFVKGGNNRVILATDGDFNVGVSSNAAMEQLVEEKRESGVFLTVLGFGMGNYKDSKMEIMADKGNGNYAYIDNILEAKKVFVNEFGGTLFTIAKDVKLQLEFNPAKVKGYRLIGYENRMLRKEDFNNDKKDAGELGSGHTVTALYEIIPAGIKDSPFLPSVDALKYQQQPAAFTPAATTNELLTIKLRYKQPDGITSKLIKKEVFDQQFKLGKVSENFRFSAAVAAFGMLLRNSEYKGSATYNLVLELAQGAKGKDEEGCRAEFINLVKSIQLVAKR